MERTGTSRSAHLQVERQWRLVPAAHAHRYAAAMRLSVPRPALLALATAAGLCSSGCLPMRYTSAVGASGRVADAKTEAPVSAAYVALAAPVWPPHPGSSFVETRTTGGGAFRIPAQHRWVMHSKGDKTWYGPAPAMLTVRHDGYDVFTRECRMDTDEDVINVGEVRLQPLSK